MGDEEQVMAMVMVLVIAERCQCGRVWTADGRVSRRTDVKSGVSSTASNYGL